MIQHDIVIIGGGPAGLAAAAALSDFTFMAENGSSGKEKRRRGYSDSGARQCAGWYLKSVYPQWFWSSYL